MSPALNFFFFSFGAIHPPSMVRRKAYGNEKAERADLGKEVGLRADVWARVRFLTSFENVKLYVLNR